MSTLNSLAWRQSQLQKWTCYSPPCLWSCCRSSGWHGQSAVGSRMPWGCAKDYLGGCYQRLFRNLQSWCSAVLAILCTAQWCFSGWISGLCPSSFSKTCLLVSQSLIYSHQNSLDDDLGRILLGTDNRVMPLQLLQLLRAPFFRIFTMMPSVQSSGSSFSSHMIWLQRVAEELVLQTPDLSWIALR